jgi:LysM repeat protein
MSAKSSIRLIISFGILAALFASPKPAFASSSCGGTYVAKEGETLWTIASTCGTTVAAIRQANPSIGFWLHAGQTLSVPGTQSGGQTGGTNYGYQGAANCQAQYSGSCYGTQNSGNCYGTPSMGNCYVSNCYGSQYHGSAYGSTAGVPTYVVQTGDTLRKIADRLGIPLCDLIFANPQIANPDLIYPGQVICLPAYMAQTTHRPGVAQVQPTRPPKLAGNMYRIDRGETLKEIARKFDLTVESIMAVNPTIRQPGYIHPGMVIRLW